MNTFGNYSALVLSTFDLRILSYQSKIHLPFFSIVPSLCSGLNKFKISSTDLRNIVRNVTHEMFYNSVLKRMLGRA